MTIVRRRRLLCAATLTALLAVLPLGSAPGAAEGATAATALEAAHVAAPSVSAKGTWLWPVAGRRAVQEPFRAPAHDYGPGHRGIDIVAAVGARVGAPAEGVVAFRGTVVDRPLLTVDHGEGVVTTFEPLESDLRPGEPVTAGQELGVVAVGGHAEPGSVHLGVRVHGEYVNPLPYFGDVPRAVLLPCCEPL